MTETSFHTVEDVATLLKVRPEWVRKQIRDGQLAHTLKIGRHYRISDTQLQAFIARQAGARSCIVRREATA